MIDGMIGRRDDRRIDGDGEVIDSMLAVKVPSIKMVPSTLME